MQKKTIKHKGKEYVVLQEIAPERGEVGEIILTAVSVSLTGVDILRMSIFILEGGGLSESYYYGMFVGEETFQLMIQLWLDGPQFAHIGNEKLIMQLKEGLPSSSLS